MQNALHEFHEASTVLANPKSRKYLVVTADSIPLIQVKIAYNLSASQASSNSIINHQLFSSK